MKLFYSKEFKKRYKKLSPSIQKQVNKQILLLQTNFRHPSLKSKKMGGYENAFEARVSRGYRMRYLIEKGMLIFLTVGQHDAGLGIK